jgi:hypothetical protein
VTLTVKDAHASSPYHYLSSHNERKKVHNGHFNFILPNVTGEKELIFLQIINLKYKNVIYKKTISFGM